MQKEQYIRVKQKKKSTLKPKEQIYTSKTGKKIWQANDALPMQFIYYKYTCTLWTRIPYQRNIAQYGEKTRVLMFNNT